MHALANTLLNTGSLLLYSAISLNREWNRDKNPKRKGIGIGNTQAIAQEAEHSTAQLIDGALSVSMCHSLCALVHRPMIVHETVVHLSKEGESLSLNDSQCTLPYSAPYTVLCLCAHTDCYDYHKIPISPFPAIPCRT